MKTEKSYQAHCTHNVVYEYCFGANYECAYPSILAYCPPYLATVSPYKDLLVCCNSLFHNYGSWDHANSLYSCKFDAYIDLSHKQTSNLLTKLYYSYILDCKFI